MSAPVRIEGDLAVTARCGALTGKGTVCRNYALNADGLCWRHDGRPALPYTPRTANNASKVCRVCGHERPARMFRAGPINPKTGEAYRVRTCHDCEEKARRAAGIPERHPRYDAHGQVWCHNCQQYLSRESFRWATCPSLNRPRYWSYCRACERKLDGLRLKRRRGTAEWERDTERRAKQQRRTQRARRDERRQFVQDAITLLRRRGLTKAEICKLARVSFGSLIDWERGERRVLSAVEARFCHLLLITADFPLADEPASRRRLPHPELPRLIAAMKTTIEQFPVRSRWSNAA